MHLTNLQLLLLDIEQINDTLNFFYITQVFYRNKILLAIYIVNKNWWKISEQVYDLWRTLYNKIEKQNF